MLGQAVALRRPAARAAEGEHPRVLAGAVVVDPLGGRPSCGPQLEVVLGRLGPGEQRRARRRAARRVAVGGAGDRELAVVAGRRARGERQRLERLRRGAHERDERRVAGRRDDLAVADRDGVDAVHRLDDPVPRRTATLIGVSHEER